MRPCISIRGFVRPSVRPSVGRSVRPSVRNAFFQNLLNALYMIGNDRELNEYQHRALGRSWIIPISKIICPISEEIRWTHLCSDWNLFLNILMSFYWLVYSRLVKSPTMHHLLIQKIAQACLFLLYTHPAHNFGIQFLTKSSAKTNGKTARPFKKKNWKGNNWGQNKRHEMTRYKQTKQIMSKQTNETTNNDQQSKQKRHQQTT